MIEVEKKKITKAGLLNAFKLYHYIKPFQKEYFVGVIFLFLSSLGNLAFPKLLGEMVNSATSLVPDKMNHVALLLGLVLLLNAVFSYFRVVLFNNVTEKALAFLRRDTYNHLIRLPLKFFEQHRVGELNSRISADITLLQETMTTTLAELIRQLIIIIGGITLLAITSIKLTLFMLVILPPTMVFARMFGKYIRKISKEVQSEVAKSNTVVEETLQGIQSVKAYTNEFFEMARYRKKTESIAEMGMRSGKYRGAFASFIILGLFGALAAVIWKGSAMLAKGELIPGDLFSFVIYSAFVGGTIGGLASVFTSIQKFLGATEELFALFNENEEELMDVNHIDPAHELHGQISFKKLSFAYPMRKDEMVLRDIDIDVSSNQLIALVGPSGAGKSTMASLLLGLHKPTKGKILFDGRDQDHFPLSVIRKQIALVPQDIFLFGGSIRENIAYGIDLKSVV